MMEDQSYVGERVSDTLLLDVFPGEGSWLHYVDDGESFAYEKGLYQIYQLTVVPDGDVQVKILHDGFNRPYRKIRVIEQYL